MVRCCNPRRCLLLLLLLFLLLPPWPRDSCVAEQARARQPLNQVTRKISSSGHLIICTPHPLAVGRKSPPDQTRPDQRIHRLHALVLHTICTRSARNPLSIQSSMCTVCNATTPYAAVAYYTYQSREDRYNKNTSTRAWLFFKAIGCICLLPQDRTEGRVSNLSSPSPSLSW